MYTCHATCFLHGNVCILINKTQKICKYHSTNAKFGIGNRDTNSILAILWSILDDVIDMIYCAYKIFFIVRSRKLFDPTNL